MSLYQFRDVGCVAMDAPSAVGVAAAAACAGCVCVYKGCKVHMQAEQSAAFTLDHEVDVVTCWREEGACLVAMGDRSGTLHIASPALQAIVHSQAVERQALPCNQPVFSALEIAVLGQGQPCLLVLAKSSCLYIVPNLPLHDLAACGELAVAETGQLSQLDLSAVHTQGPAMECTLINVAPTPYILTAGSGPWPLALWRLGEQSQLSPASLVAATLSGARVMQAACTCDGGYLVTLTEQCEVQVWLVAVMVVLGVWGGREGEARVTQLSLYTSGGQQDHRLCVLCQGQGEWQVVVLSLPGLKQLFSIEVSANTSLAASKPGQETVYVLQPESSGVRVSALEYGSPEERVAALVSQGKFEEAEHLAHIHHLDPEVVVSGKAAMLNQRICAGDEGQQPAFLQCLEKIKDVGPTAELVLQSQYLSLATTQALLAAISTELAGRGSWDSVTARRVASALDRLTTFSLIAGQEGYSGEVWGAFQSSPCLQLLRHLLLSGQLQHAQLFWARHQLALHEELASLDMRALVRLVPTDASAVVPWLSTTLLPFLLIHSPHQLGALLEELRDMLCSMELSEPENWPANALSLTEQLLASLLELCLRHSCPPDVAALVQLRARLVKLTSVLATLQCPLSLAAYEQSSTEQLVYRALDQAVSPASLRSLISERLVPFAEEHEICLDTVMLNYLQLFLARAPTHSPDFPGSPWEAKAVALAGSLTDSECRVAGCLELLRRLSLPWSKAMESLVQQCLQEETANVGELHSLHDLLELKAMLHRNYGILDFNFSDSNTGQLYIRRMLLQDRPSVLSDALRVAAMYNISESKVHMHHLFNLCCRDKVEEARDVLHGLPTEAQTSTAHSTLSFCLHRLKLPYSLGQREAASHCGAAHLAVLCADVLALHSPEAACAAEWRGECSPEQLRRLRDLAVDFSLILSPQQLASPLHTQQLLHQTLAGLTQPSAGCCVPSRTLRLCRMLGFSEQEVASHLAGLRLGQATPTDTLTLLEGCPARLTLPLLRSALCASDSSISPSTAHCLCSLAMCASTTCPPAELPEALHVLQACRALSDVLALCELEGQSERARWPWAARFSEQGLLLEPAQVVPSCLQLSSALLRQSARCTADCSSAVVRLLQSNGHIRPAHHIAVQCQLYLDSPEPAVRLLSSLLDKVLSMGRVDHSYGLALLLATSPDQALQTLHSQQRSSLSSYSRVIALCVLTADYSQLCPVPQLRERATAHMTSALWGKQLRKYQVSFSAALRGGSDEKKKVLSQLLHTRAVAPRLLLVYCRTYGLDWSGALLTRVRVALTEWSSGYQEACRLAMTALGTHRFLPSILNTFLTSKVCPYDYERIRFVLHHLLLRAGDDKSSSHHQQMQLLLATLETYSRCSSPSEEERAFHSAHCHSVCRADMAPQQVQLQGNSARKLPLHLLLENQLGLALLGREVQHISAVARLAPIARLINLTDDQFYCTALRSLAAMETGRPRFPELIPLLSCISHTPTRLALTAHLASQLSSDTDREAALEAVLRQHQDEKGGQLSEGALQLQLREVRTRQLLLGAGLGCYRHLAGDEAATIITILYSDLPLREDRPEAAAVHKVAQALAALHCVGLAELTSQLLEEWLLPPNMLQQDLNTTLVQEMREVEVRQEQEEGSGDNWSRMVYLLTDNPNTEQHAALLCRWARTASPVVSTHTRTRALQLLLAAIPRAVLDRVSGISVAELREEVQRAVFVGELASLQLSLTVEAFQASNKEALAGSLLRSRSNSPKALRLVADLCLHYRMLSPGLWARLLDALLALNMTGFLQRVLPRLVGMGAHHTVRNLSRVWQAVVQAPYEAGGASSLDCLAALDLLYKYPVVFQLDLASIVQAMAGAGARSHALAACLLLPLPQRTASVEAVLSELPAGGLPQLLHEITGSSSPQLSAVAGVVYDHVDRTGQHEALLGSPHFPHLVQHLISQHRLASLLAQSLAHGRVTEAAHLVEMYNSQHSCSAPSGVEGLKAYLTDNGMDSLWDTLEQ